MATRASSAELSALKLKVEEWRARRSRRTRIPEALWDEAVRVAGQAGLWAVAKATRFHYPDLKERAVGAGRRAGRSRALTWRAARRSGRAGTKGTAGAGRGVFVELPRETAGTGTRTVVEFVGQGGDRMRIETAGGVDLAGLARAFLGRDAR